MKKILIINEVHSCVFEILETSHIDYDYKPTISIDSFLETIPLYEGLILSSKFIIDKEIIDLAKNLKVIGRIGAGVENIDTNYAESKGIACHNAPEGNRDAVGEQAIGMLLMLANNLGKANNEVREGIWLREENRGYEIKGKTIGIIGYGNMGNAFAQRLLGFEATVLAYDKYKINYGNPYAKEVNLDTIFKETDILSIHTPLTHETFMMLNDSFFEKFAKPIIIINTARGKIIDTKALVSQMKKDKVLGACLDVLEYESHDFKTNFTKNTPETLDFLINSNKVVLSPHIAGWTHESKYKLCKFITQKVVRTLSLE